MSKLTKINTSVYDNKRELIPVMKDFHKEIAIGDIVKERKVCEYGGESRSLGTRYYVVTDMNKRLIICKSPYGFSRAFSNTDYNLGVVSKVYSEKEKELGMKKKTGAWFK